MATLVVTNTGTTAVAGPVSISLYLSGGPVLDAGSALVASSTRNMSLKPSFSKRLRLAFKYPDAANGDYYIVTQVTDPDGKTNTAPSGSTIRVAKPFVSFSGSVPTPSEATRKAKAIVTVLVQDMGNVPASGILHIDLFASADAMLDAMSLPVGTFSRGLHVRPSSRNVLRLPLAIAGAVPTGQYRIIARLEWSGAVPNVTASNILVSATTITVL